jgi:hypothetical protein
MLNQRTACITALARRIVELMTGEEVVTQAWDACDAFGKCGKFAGAATVEVVKQALADEGLPTSVRDVFIKGLPVEWDRSSAFCRAHAERSYVRARTRSLCFGNQAVWTTWTRGRAEDGL